MTTKNFPTTILAGDTLKVTIESPDYTAADGFGVRVYLTGPSGSNEEYPGLGPYEATLVEGTATEFELVIAHTETATFAAGLYAYAIVAASETGQYTVEQGNTTVKLRADQVEGDFRSAAQKIIDNIDAVLTNRATSDQMSYTINGRSLSRTPIPELLRLRDYYKNELAKEDGKVKKVVRVWLPR